jgi:hypothetical protein
MDRCKYFFRSKVNHSPIDMGAGRLVLIMVVVKKETVKRNRVA